jgi:hypothetical protein
MTTLPTIHLNGTSAGSLEREYKQVRVRIQDAISALEAATCNQRDFYPQAPEAWTQARDERAQAFALLQQVSDYVEEWEAHAANHSR